MSPYFFVKAAVNFRAPMDTLLNNEFLQTMWMVS